MHLLIYFFYIRLKKIGEIEGPKVNYTDIRLLALISRLLDKE